MAVVRDIQSVLSDAVGAEVERLTESRDDIEVCYALTLSPVIEVDDPEEEGAPLPVYQAAVLWRVGLVITRQGGQPISVFTYLPSCAGQNGDPEPILGAVRSLWNQYCFGSLILSEGLDEELDKVADEAEGG